MVIKRIRKDITEQTAVMREGLAEESVIFVSVLKWVFLASCIGIIVGIAATIFLKLLHWAVLVNKFPYYFYFLPLALVLTVIITRLFAPDAEGHGTENVIRALHRNAGRINVMVVPIKIITSVLTIAFGGSAGKEGPCAQIGAGLSSFFSDLFKFDEHDRKKLVICGISAGFAAVFGTPIAGAIFGVEVLFAGSIVYEALLPSFIAGVVGYQVSSFLGIEYFYHPLEFAPVLKQSLLLEVLIAGVFFGLCAFLLIEMMKYSSKLAKKLPFNKLVKAFLGGLIIIGLASVFSTQYLGLGLDTIENTLEGGNVVWSAFILKSLFTSITLSFGGSGGIITPIFFIGSTAGAFFGHIAGLDVGTFAAIGLVSLLAGAAGTPIAASILAVELFGAGVAPYAALACIISFLMTGHRSVFPSQMVSMRKSASIQLELGGEIENVHIKVDPRKTGLTGTGIKVAEKIRERMKKKRRF